MNRKFYFFFFLSSFLFSDETANTLNAMQQLRTLMPERLWVQEFNIRIDRKGFKEYAQKMIDRRERERAIDYGFAVGRSHKYLLRSTMSGENIRILDLYQEFEESPFWKTPELIAELRQMEGCK
jgi:hypothetical protein